MGARRRILNNSPHIESASGNMASFKTDIVSALKECKVHFNAIQEGSGDPSPTNVRPISGRTGLTLTRAGINLLQCDTFADGRAKGITYSGIRSSNGELESVLITGTGTGSNLFRNLNYASGEQKWFPDGRYATYAYAYGVDVIPVRKNNGMPKDTNGKTTRTDTDNVWRYWDLVNDNSNGDQWFRVQLVPNNATGIAFNSTAYPIICTAEDAECDFEPYKGVEIPISWQSQLGTLYGGYVDLVSGEIVINRNLMILNGADNWKATATNKFYFEGIPSGAFAYQPDTGNVSNMYPYSGTAQIGSSGVTVDHSFYLQHAGRGGGLFYDGVWVYDSNYTLSTFKEMLNTTPLRLTYVLQTPIHYQLSPQTIKTLKGRNNIWCDNETHLEVEYWTH